MQFPLAVVSVAAFTSTSVFSSLKVASGTQSRIVPERALALDPQDLAALHWYQSTRHSAIGVGLRGKNPTLSTALSGPLEDGAVNTKVAPRREEKMASLKRDGAASISRREAIAASTAERGQQEMAASMEQAGTVSAVYAAVSDKVDVPVDTMMMREDEASLVLKELPRPVSRPADEAPDNTKTGRVVSCRSGKLESSARHPLMGVHGGNDQTLGGE
jgi:hypothetical protein